MDSFKQDMKQKIREEMTQIQAELDKTLQAILRQAEGKIQPERQEEVEQKMAGTQQLLERLKSNYA